MRKPRERRTMPGLFGKGFTSFLGLGTTSSIHLRMSGGEAKNVCFLEGPSTFTQGEYGRRRLHVFAFCRNSSLAAATFSSRPNDKTIFARLDHRKAWANTKGSLELLPRQAFQHRYIGSPEHQFKADNGCSSDDFVRCSRRELITLHNPRGLLKAFSSD